MVAVAEISDVIDLPPHADVYVNAKNSQHFLSIDYFYSMNKHIEEKGKSFILDVEKDANLALQAMDKGFKTILFRGEEEVQEKLESIADKKQVTIISTLNTGERDETNT